MKKATILIIFILSITIFNSNAQPIDLGNGLTQHGFQWPPGILQKKIKSIVVDASDKKWIGTKYYGVINYSDTIWSQYYNVAGGQLPSDTVNCLAVEGNILYVGTTQGVAKHDGTVWVTYNEANSGIPDNNITTILSKGNSLWVGTNNGVAKFDGTVWTSYSTTNSQLIDDKIQAIEQTANGDIWFGTINGLSKLSGSIWTTFDTTNSALDDNNIQSLCVDIDDDLWVGTMYASLYSACKKTRRN